jgi:cell division protein FtsQ
VKPLPTNRRVDKDPPTASRGPEPAAAPTRKTRRGPVLAALRTAVGVVLVAAISGAVAWGARTYVKTSPRFGVSEIVVTGGHFRSADQIAELAQIKKGDNVFALDLDDAKRKLTDDPWIHEAQLARRLPGTVYVRVTEREAAATVSLSGDVYLVARDGEIFKRLEPGDPVDLPVITGLSQEAVAEDREGVKASLRRALDLAGDYDRGSLAPKALLEEIHLAADGTVTLIVGKSGLVLALGAPPYRRKLEQASRVVSELERRKEKPDAILLDNEARPERVVVRVK